jgi:hypothetical protein
MTALLLLLGLLSRGALGQGAGKSDPGKKDKAPAGGYVAFIQRGGYLVDCRVTWKQRVKDKTGKSKRLDKEWTKKVPSGMDRRCDLPPGATAIKVSVKVHAPDGRGKVILRDIELDPKEFAAPPRVTYTLTGALFREKAKAELDEGAPEALRQPRSPERRKELKLPLPKGREAEVRDLQAEVQAISRRLRAIEKRLSELEKHKQE